MARSMLSLGMLAALALRMTVLRRGFMSGSPPPWRAVMLSSLMSFVKAWPRFASAMPFLCLIVCHLLWPDMFPLLLLKFKKAYHKRKTVVNMAGCSAFPNGGLTWRGLSVTLRPGNRELRQVFRGKPVRQLDKEPVKHHASG